eukprot:TRINITY_DN14034_c0_g1_i1.p2 TRINITY_DN14034_c0_g1~~TRINITY_DN14034_c0_g1_i1.p2  ORF type:complete len:241 (-),score=39.02 TRINITY_DN14034_c0_g1_i1:92-814(-)
MASAWEVIRKWRGALPYLRDANEKGHKDWPIYIAYALLIALCILEIYTATIPILLAVQEKASDTPWIVYVATGWPRILFFTFACVLLDPVRFVVQMFKIDAVMVTGAGSVLAYGFFVSSIDTTGIFITAIITYGFLVLTMSAEIRLMVKYFPWSSGSIWLYKMVRGYHVLFFIAVELTQKYNDAVDKAKVGSKKKEDPYGGMQYTFLVTTLTWVVFLFALVYIKEIGMHAAARAARQSSR